MLASVGRFLQGAGGVFALIGAAYIATTSFPASHAATLIGATQMFGMAGGAAGQFAVGPAIGAGLHWSAFWIAMGVAGLVIAALVFFFMPSNAKMPGGGIRCGRRLGQEIGSRHLDLVARNPQSIPVRAYCGGLMFLPTTIFDMLWGVRFLQEAHNVPYGLAVLCSASVPFGWIIGCPLLGALSDRIGRRKPVILGGAILVLVCLTLILYGKRGSFPTYSLGLVLGIASGAAMLPYTMIKEANRPEHSGTATGVINFINFSLSALLGPLFGALLAGASAEGPRQLIHYQMAFAPLVFGVVLAILLTLFLRETGPARLAAGGNASPASLHPSTKPGSAAN